MTRVNVVSHGLSSISCVSLSLKVKTPVQPSPYHIFSSSGPSRDGFALTTLPWTSRGTDVQVESTTSGHREEENANWLAHELTTALFIAWANRAVRNFDKERNDPPYIPQVRKK